MGDSTSRKSPALGMPAGREAKVIWRLIAFTFSNYHLLLGYLSDKRVAVHDCTATERSYWLRYRHWPSAAAAVRLEKHF